MFELTLTILLAMIPSRSRGSGNASWTRADWLCITLVTSLGGLLRVLRLAEPPALVFDETYYAKDACWYVLASSKCGLSAEQNVIHPPLGKWLTAAGIDVFGYESFGWRIPSAVLGTLMIAVLYLLARKILSSTTGAVLASGLLTFDFLHFVQSRVAMLDIFVAFFGLASVLCVTYDRDRLQRAEGDRSPRRLGLLHRPWRALAGVALGGAVASKWSGVLFVALCLALTLAWEASARRRNSRGEALRRALKDEAASVVVWLLLLPAAIYLLSYVGRLDGTLLAPPWEQHSWLYNFWTRQRDMASFHFGLEGTHSYQSPAWSWLLLKRPVAYYFATTASGSYKEILSLGNPFVWWSSALALLYVTVEWARRREPVGPEGVIVAGFGFTYFPWLLSSRPAVFLFYLLPAVPFMALALAFAAIRIGRSWEARLTVALFSAATIGLFAYYYPLIAAVPLPYQQWRDRIWIFGDTRSCAKPRDDATAKPPAAGQKRAEQANELPPKGWCWI